MPRNHYFISYSNAKNETGGDFALKLHDELESGHAKMDAWLDKRDKIRSTGRRTWDQQIEKAIRDCNALLLVLTPDSVRRNSVCDKEWRYALSNKKPVVLLRLMECDVPMLLHGLPFNVEFSMFQLIEFPFWRVHPLQVLS